MALECCLEYFANHVLRSIPALDAKVCNNVNLLMYQFVRMDICVHRCAFSCKV